MRLLNELPTSLRLGAASRLPAARVRLAGLAETEISFPSSILFTEGGRGQTLSGCPNKQKRKEYTLYEAR
jgi:hypothetical protein